MNRPYMTDTDLTVFAQKVLRLNAEGLAMLTIAKRFGIARTTLSQRMQRARRRKLITL